VDWNAKAPAKASSDLDDLLSIPSTTQQHQYQQQLQQQQQQNMYHQVCPSVLFDLYSACPSISVIS
jgi:hypothetical protein